MGAAPLTRPSLVVRIGDARDAEAWAQFMDVYAPLIHGFARKHGLQDADSADLTQEVLRAVAASARRLHYDPAKGSFRGWLFTVVRNKLRNFLAAQARRCRGTGDSAAQAFLEAQPAPEESQAIWEREYEQRLLAWAAEQVRDSFQEASWQAFWRTAVNGESAKVVAGSLGMTVGAVYIAKSRVLARLKERIQQVQDE